MIVVSDMMGTLTTGSPFLGLVDWVKHNQSKLRASFYMASITPSYWLAKNGLIDWQVWGQKLMVESLAYIKDANLEKLRHASGWVVEHDLWKNRREDVVATSPAPYAFTNYQSPCSTPYSSTPRQFR